MPTVVVRGPACSGKTTWTQTRTAQLRAEGHEPIVIDFDLIAEALGSQRTHGHPDHFVPVVQRMRGLAIRAALEASRNTGCWVLIVDSSIPESRMRLYRDAGAQILTMDTPLAECHRRADAAGRPPQWHDLIDAWSPEQADTPWGQRRWPKRPAHRKGANGRAYAAKRRRFLTDKTNCQRCGKPFRTDIPCSHRTCYGKGCHHHADYPTVQHLEHLIDGGPSMDESTWAAWCKGCNSGEGAVIGNQRRAGTYHPERRRGVELDWGTGGSPTASSPAAGQNLSLDW